MCAYNKSENGLRGADPQGGFTLIETIVALIIFVACYVLIQQGLSLGWRGVRTSEGEIAALHIAQAQMAAVGLETPLTEGQTSGQTDNGFDWTIDIRRQNADTESESRARSRPSGYWVAVEVNWRDDATRRSRSLQLKTLKIALPQ